MSNQSKKPHELPPLIDKALEGAPPFTQAVLRAYIEHLIDSGNMFFEQRNRLMVMVDQFIADMELAFNKPDEAANKQATELFARLKASKS